MDRPPGFRIRKPEKPPTDKPPEPSTEPPTTPLPPPQPAIQPPSIDDLIKLTDEEKAQLRSLTLEQRIYITFDTLNTLKTVAQMMGLRSPNLPTLPEKAGAVPLGYEKGTPPTPQTRLPMDEVRKHLEDLEKYYTGDVGNYPYLRKERGKEADITDMIDDPLMGLIALLESSGILDKVNLLLDAVISKAKGEVRK